MNSYVLSVTRVPGVRHKKVRLDALSRSADDSGVINVTFLRDSACSPESSPGLT
jgi:hypothetical protein